MSSKISDFFKIEAKKSNIEETSSNQIQVRECRVVLTDINQEIRNEKFITLPIAKTKSDISQIKDIIKKQEKSSKSMQSECNFCGIIVLKKNISRHKRMYCKKELLDSPNYHKTFNQNFLSFNVTKKHIASETEKYECDFDGKMFGTKIRIRDHMKTHLPKVKCEICSKIITVLSLNYHIKQTHSTESNFQCKICSKLFKNKKLMRFHEKIHDKKFQCVICNVKFPNKTQLTNHIGNIHENPGSYQCKICDKKFLR